MKINMFNSVIVSDCLILEQPLNVNKYIKQAVTDIKSDKNNSQWNCSYHSYAVQYVWLGGKIWKKTITYMFSKKDSMKMSDFSTSCLKYWRLKSTGCCRVLKGAQNPFENFCLISGVWLAHDWRSRREWRGKNNVCN